MKLISKPNKPKKKIIIFLLTLIITITIVFKKIDNSEKKYDNKKLVNALITKTIKQDHSYFEKLTKEIITDIYNNPTKYLIMSQLSSEKIKIITTPVYSEKEESKPLIYIYNTHQTEEYTPSNFVEYNVKPTVTMANYIMEEIFNKNNYKTIVEESNIKEIRVKNNWNYSSSYKASRLLLEQRKNENSSLKYFIDIHRDSVSKEKTTTTINDKEYARILFIIGLENNNYQENLSFTEEINNCLNDKYPNLSRGIYKKSGPGVNGIYNQDFSKYTILVEMGGYENTTNEVLNSSIAFSNCFMEVILNHESKPNS